MSKLFCLCADDFALTDAISQSILTLLAEQRIQATSCMTQSSLWQRYSGELKTLKVSAQVGLHINFTQSFDGYFSLPLKTLMVKAWSHQLNSQTILHSLEQQWQMFVDAMGRAPDFVDGHQHVHQFPIIRDALIDFLQQKNFQGWVRNLSNTLPPPRNHVKNRVKTWLLPNLGAHELQAMCQSYHFAQNEKFAGIYDFDEISNSKDYAAFMQYWMANAPEESSTLVMCHPCQTISDSFDPIAEARVKEYAYLSSVPFLVDCEIMDVKLGVINQSMRRAYD